MKTLNLDLVTSSHAMPQAELSQALLAWDRKWQEVKCLLWAEAAGSTDFLWQPNKNVMDLVRQACQVTLQSVQFCPYNFLHMPLQVLIEARVSASTHYFAEYLQSACSLSAKKERGNPE